MAPADNTTSSVSRTSTKRWLYAAIILWAISFCLMAAFGTYVLIKGQQVNAALCHVTNDNRIILKNILDTARSQSLSRVETPYQRNLIRQSYNELLALIPPLDCTVQGGPQELEP